MMRYILQLHVNYTYIPSAARNNETQHLVNKNEAGGFQMLCYSQCPSYNQSGMLASGTRCVHESATYMDINAPRHFLKVSLTKQIV